MRELVAKSQSREIPRPKVAAVDLDGTILYPLESGELGDPLPGVREKLIQLQTNGWKIIIWTVRSDSEELQNHLRHHKIPFDFVNQHPWQPPDGGPKIIADIYIDDRSITFDGKASTYDKIENFKTWWKTNK